MKNNERALLLKSLLWKKLTLM